MIEKMKRVLELGEFISIPQSFIKCSICLCWNEKDSYCTDMHGIIQSSQQRTNCQSCYESPQVEWEKIKRDAQLKELKLSEEAQLEKAMNTLRHNCISVKDMIKQLQELPENAMLMIGGKNEDEIFSDIDLRKKKIRDLGEYSHILSILDNELEIYQIG